ncbi:DUF3179 domain-containing protein [Reichenbachiella versicolor]|uniref:DUF3179 domain-containing protein n=1 Tax=Reichenbachiella versicolor TaxID=1821036 RepID=UPI000D6E7C69|nr:DUF3179 domain-containing protein [Reichenbachiella versicolor]
MKMTFPLAVLILLTFWSCDEANESASISGDWLIPINEIRDGGPGKDGIPALINPELIEAETAGYLEDEDLIIGIIDEDEIRAYPHKILDWHEIINDDIGNKSIAITYCPLTGTAIGWDRILDGNKTTFGVSGLLYNSNLIPYDRATDSNWSQIGLKSVNGTKIGETIVTHQLVETTWKTWKTFYPNTKVVSTNTGHSRNYDRYPYGDYKTSSSLIFPVNNENTSLNRKERVHGIIVDNKVKVYRFNQINNLVIHDVIENEKVVIVGQTEQNFILSFKIKKIETTELEFELPDSHSEENGFSNGEILKDQLGNTYDIFGKAVSGPNTGEKLEPTESFIGYWFSWPAFYPNTEIYVP